jgi:hypothetical protein
MEPTSPAAPAAPAAAPAATPAINPSDAGRTLREAREARRNAALTPPAAAKVDAAQPVAAAPAAKPEASTDEVLALVRKERALNEGRAALEREREAMKANQPDLDMVKAIKDARTKGDRLAVLKAVGFTDADLYEGEGALFHQLLELAKGAPAKEAAPDIAALVAAELERKEAERVASMSEERKTAREARLGKADVWHGELVGFANANLKDYPAIKAYGSIDPTALINPDYYAPGHPWHDPQQEPGYVQKFLNWSKGRMPTHKEVLDAFESQYREDAKARMTELAPTLGFEALRAPASAAFPKQQDGPPPAAATVESLDDIKLRRKALLMRPR